MAPVELPQAFVSFRELVQIHLHKMLEIPKKHPIHAVALLVVVAVEALSKLLDWHQPKDFFAKEYLARRDVPEAIGRDLFDSLRNGLAHIYAPYPIYVGARVVLPTMAWKDSARFHLSFTGATMDAAGNLHVTASEPGSRSVRLVLNVETMVDDLTLLFADVETRLLAEPELRGVVARRASEIREEDSKRPEGVVRTEWEAFIEARQVASLRERS
jgi:hypothetical protein